MDTYFRSYVPPQGNGLIARARRRIDRLGWTLSLFWDRGPCTVKIDVPAPRPGAKEVVVQADVSRIFATRFNEFIGPFDRELRGWCQLLITVAAFTVCTVFGDPVAGLIGGISIAIAFDMIVTGCR